MEAKKRLEKKTLQLLIDENIGVIDRTDYLHPDLSIVACRCEHERECRIPCDSIDATATVTIEPLNQAACVAMPDAYLGVYSLVSN